MTTVAEGKKVRSASGAVSRQPVLEVEYLTRAEVCLFLGISIDTLRKWEKRPDWIPQTTIGNRCKYSRTALAEWLEQQTDTRRRDAWANRRAVDDD